MELSRRADLTVIVPMAMRPGRRLRSVGLEQGLRVVRVCAPVIPGMEQATLWLFHAFLGISLRPFWRGLDIVHSVGVEFSGLLAGAFSARYGYCHVTQFINDLRYFRRGAFKDFPFLARTRRHLRGILCNSRALESEARRLFPEVAPVRTLYRGTDLALFHPEKGCEPEAGPSLGIRFLFLGGLPPYPDRTYGRDTKGGMTLMAAWQAQEDALYDAGATLFLGGPDADGPISRAWRNNLRHPERVELAGLVPPLEMPDRLRRADIVLLPSREEGCPNLAFEAMASGRPIAGGDIGPLRELIDPGEDGWLLTAGDPAAWGAGLVSMARNFDGPRLQALGRSARMKAERKFDHTRYSDELIAFYRDAIGNPQKRTA
jgi:glycosyltransferase involved in cell wall biosynthesis